MFPIFSFVVFKVNEKFNFSSKFTILSKAKFLRTKELSLLYPNKESIFLLPFFKDFHKEYPDIKILTEKFVDRYNHGFLVKSGDKWCKICGKLIN
jgi:hypothetical protein